MTLSTIIKMEDIHLSFKGKSFDVNILKGINLEIYAGDSIAVLGASGSGKSSMMAIMTGLEGATKGKVTALGQEITAMNEDQLAVFRRENIGIILQSFHLIPTMNALDNVIIPLELAGIKNAADIAAEALKEVGLDHRITHYPAELSGGEQQRVAVARAIAAKPKILFADEPTGNLDSKTGKAIIELIFSLQKKLNTTLVLITHDPALADKCSRKLVMNDGHLREEL